MSSESQKRVQAAILFHLEQLKESLGEFDQTTHGSIFYHKCNIDFVTDELCDVYHDPDSHNISELSQRIEAFLKEEKYDAPSRS